MNLKIHISFLYFLNKDISFNNPWKFLKFEIHIHEGHSEGIISQILYLGPGFILCNLEKYFLNCPKVTIFLS